MQITVDITAPEPGAVTDAEPGQTDKDFQSSSTVHASWTGFFDQESGIKKYEVIFGSECATADDFVAEQDTVSVENKNNF